MESISLDICIATFKRSELLVSCLNSIQSQEISSEVSIRVIVVDNDRDQSAKVVIDQYPVRGSIGELVYLFEPEKNIAKARNKALEVIEGDIVFFIDDDEVADTRWIQAHLKALDHYGCDVTLGPVTPVYPSGMPHWLVQSKVYERKRHADGRALRTAATNNTAVRSECFNDIKFNAAFGLTGGSDTELFSRLTTQGKVILWVNDAIVYEDVPIYRANLWWVLRRGYRVGQTFARVYYSDVSLKVKIKFVLYQMLLLGVSTVRVAFALFRGRASMVKYMREWSKRFGRITGVSGFYYQEYKPRE